MTAPQYITDASGKKTAVVIPIKEWQAIEKEHLAVKRKLEILTSVKEGIQEVKEARRTGRDLPLLQDLLNEGLD